MHSYSLSVVRIFAQKKITPERGEGDASDSIGGNTGELIGTVSFADGFDLTVLGSGKWLQTRRQGLSAYCVNSIVVRFRSISTTSLNQMGANGLSQLSWGRNEQMADFGRKCQVFKDFFR